MSETGVVRLPRAWYHLRLLFALSALGDSLLAFVLPYQVYAFTGSSPRTAITFLAETLPGLVIGPFAGALADRRDRRALLVLAFVAPVPAVAALLLMDRDRTWIAWVTGAVIAVVASLVGPAIGAVMRALAGRDGVVRSASLAQVIGAVTGLVAPPLGGALLGTVGFRAVVLVDLVTFVLATGWLLAVRVPTTARWAPADADAPSSVTRSMVEGVSTVVRQPLLRLLMLTALVGMLADRAAGVAFIPFVQTSLGLGAVAYGTLMSATAVGGLGVGIVLGARRSVTRPVRLLSLAMWSACAVITCLALAPGVLPVLVPLFLLIGVVASVFGIAEQATVQLAVPEAMMARIIGTFMTVAAVGQLGGIAVGGLVTAAAGPRGMLLVTGALFGLNAIAVTLRGPALTAATTVPAPQAEPLPAPAPV